MSDPLGTDYAPPLQSLAPTQYQRYLALYQYYLTVESNIQAQLTARSTDQPINDYSFNAGEGQQSTKRMTLKELMDALVMVEGLIRHYAQKIYGRGLMNHMQRRR